MYDWNKQAEEMFNTWTGVQQQMWNNWLDMTQKTPAQPMNANQVWQKSVETWENSVNNTLDAQNKWSQMWVENFSNIANVPKEALEMVQQAQEVQQNWNSAQRQLWLKWFELAKKIEPTAMMGGWDEEAQKAFQVWQESAQKIMKAHTEWARTWNNDKPK